MINTEAVLEVFGKQGPAAGRVSGTNHSAVPVGDRMAAAQTDCMSDDIQGEGNDLQRGCELEKQIHFPFINSQIFLSQ